MEGMLAIFAGSLALLGFFTSVVFFVFWKVEKMTSARLIQDHAAAIDRLKELHTVAIQRLDSQIEVERASHRQLLEEVKTNHAETVKSLRRRPRPKPARVITSGSSDLGGREAVAELEQQSIMQAARSIQSDAQKEGILLTDEEARREARILLSRAMGAM